MVLFLRYAHSLTKTMSRFSQLHKINPAVTGHRCTSKPFTSGVNFQPQNYDYFLVLDFEATCDKQTNPEPQEIIEFPVLKINGSSFEKESVFHRYVQPRVHRELTTFCTELTGIIQEMVDGKPHLETVLEEFDSWLQDEGLLSPDCKFIFVTCGNWDLLTMLPNQCKHFGIKKASYFDSWINIKKSYAEEIGTWPKDLTVMCLSLGLQIFGRLHSGIDDCHTIASVLRNLGQRGYVFRPFPFGVPEVEMSRRVQRKAAKGTEKSESKSNTFSSANNVTTDIT